MDDCFETRTLDCPDATPAGAPVLPSSSAQGYPASPWKFDEHAKQEFLEWEKTYGANSWLFTYADRYMISRAGEYVHPNELHDAVKKQGYDGDIQSLLIRLQVRASKHRIGDYVYRPRYLIVRPHKPRGLPKSTLAPLVLVPFSLADEVTADESWALHLLQRETHDRAARVMKTRKCGGGDDVFRNFFRHFDFDHLIATPISQVQEEESWDAVKISPEQRAELDDVLSFARKVRTEIEEQIGKANEIVLPSDDEAMDSKIDVLWNKIVEFQNMILPALNFARLEILMEDYENVSGSPLHLWLDQFEGIVHDFLRVYADRLGYMVFTDKVSQYERAISKKMIPEILAQLFQDLRRLEGRARDDVPAEMLLHSYYFYEISPGIAYALFTKARWQQVLREKKGMVSEWKPTVVDRTHVGDFIPGTPELVLLKPTRPHQNLTTAAERPKLMSLLKKRGRTVKPQGEEAFSVSVGNGESDANLPYFAPRAEPRSQKAIAASEMLLKKPPLHELFAEWVSKFKGSETIEYDADMCMLGISDPVQIAELRGQKIDQCKLDPVYHVRDVLQIFGHHIGEAMTVQEVRDELWTVARSGTDGALLKKSIIGMDQCVLLTIIRQALIEASRACRVLGIRKLGTVKNMRETDVDSFVLRCVDEDIYRLDYVEDAYDIARDDSAFLLALLDAKK